MRFWLVFFCIVFSFFSTAQDIRTDTIPSEDSVVTKKKRRNPLPVDLYAEGMIVYAPVATEYGYSSQIGLGLAYKGINAGLFYSLFIDDYRTFVIFPNEFDLLFANGGGYFGYNFIDTRFFEAGVRLSYSAGDMIWESSTTKEDLARDKYQVFKPEVLISLVPIRFVKLYTAIGYVKCYDLELPSVSSEDFSGLTLGLGLQVGYFKK